MSWSAHGLRYGLPASILSAIADGRTVVCNVSRTVVEDLRRRFGNVLVVEVTAPADILSERLSARGREEGGSLEDRIGRAGAIRDVRPDLVIVNAASLAEASCAFVAALRDAPGRLRAAPRSGRALTSAAPRDGRRYDPSIRASVATPAGLEPATYGLEGSCSIQLSYGAPRLSAHSIQPASFL